MRILQAGVAIEGGGAEQVIQDLGLGLAARGHEVIIAYLEGTDDVVPSLEAAGIECVRLLERRQLAEHWWSDITPECILQMRKLLLRHRPDIIHVHIPRPSMWMGLASRLVPHAPPLIYTQHSLHSSLTARGDLAHKAFLPRTAEVICVSEAVRAEFVERWSRFRGGVTTIHNGISPDRVRPGASRRDARSALGASEDARIICNVANIRHLKGHDILAQAIARLQTVDTDIQCWCAGGFDHEPNTTQRLRSLVERLGIDAQMKMLGPRSDVPDLLNASDIFVLASRQEGLPITILEAMAAGKPVVATDVGGCSEVVRSGESGFIVPPEDPVALADAIERLLTDPELSARMGAAGRKCVTEDFSVDAMIQKHLQVYEHVDAGQ